MKASIDPSLQTSVETGIIAGMGEMRKITVEVPEELIASIQASAKTGLTETVREALEQMRQRQVQNEARKFRGKIKFGTDLMKLREDED